MDSRNLGDLSKEELARKLSESEEQNCYLKSVISNLQTEVSALQEMNQQQKQKRAELDSKYSDDIKRILLEKGKLEDEIIKISRPSSEKTPESQKLEQALLLIGELFVSNQKLREIITGPASGFNG